MPPPPGLIEIDSDAGLAERIRSAEGGPVRLVGGDVLRSVGGPSVGADVLRLPIDVLRVRADERPLVAVAHVVVRRGRWAGWWRGAIVAVMNVDRMGSWDVAPRAHPDDGRFDVVEVDERLGLRGRWQAWRRLPTGTHVPHPQIHARRARSASWDFDPPRRLWVDGVERGTVRSLEVSVEPDAAIVHT